MTKEQERCVTEFLMWWLMTYGGEPVDWNRLGSEEHNEKFDKYSCALFRLGISPPPIVDDLVCGDGVSRAKLNAWAWSLLNREEI